MKRNLLSSPRRSGSVPLFIALALASVLARGTFSAEADRLAPTDLLGTIQTKDNQPIHNASVFIYTAGPRVGPGYL